MRPVIEGSRRGNWAFYEVDRTGIAEARKALDLLVPAESRLVLGGVFWPQSIDVHQYRLDPLTWLSSSFSRAFAAEAVGTFALVFAGTGAIVLMPNGRSIGHVGIGMMFGLVIMVMIYAVGHISGAHFNPAVTLSFAVGRHFAWKHVPHYWAAQLIGELWRVAGPGLFGTTADLGSTVPRRIS